MTWTGQSFSVGQVLTAAQMNNLQADITAVTNGDAGAPTIQTAGIGADQVTADKIANNSITRDQLSTSGSSSSGSLVNASVEINMTSHSLFPMIYNETPDEWTMKGHSTDNTNTDPQFRMTHAGGVDDYSVEWRYVDA